MAKPYPIVLVGGPGDGKKVDGLPGQVAHLYSRLTDRGRHVTTTYLCYAVDFDKREMYAKPQTGRLRKRLEKEGVL